MPNNLAWICSRVVKAPAPPGCDEDTRIVTVTVSTSDAEETSSGSSEDDGKSKMIIWM